MNLSFKSAMLSGILSLFTAVCAATSPFPGHPVPHPTPNPTPTNPVNYSQQTISFDNPLGSGVNDLVSYFSVNDSAFTWAPSGGLSGGGIQPKQFTSWGNSVALFYRNFESTPGSTLSASVDFYYDPKLVNPGIFERPVGIFLSPLKDPNHYILCYIDPSFQMFGSSALLQIFTYSWAASNTGDAAAVFLSEGWHRLTASVTMVPGQFGDQVYVQTQVLDLGVSGFQPPSVVASTSGTFYDPFFANDRIQVSLHGAQWGGAKILDNFSVAGPLVPIAAPQPTPVTPAPTPVPEPEFPTSPESDIAAPFREGAAYFRQTYHQMGQPWLGESYYYYYESIARFVELAAAGRYEEGMANYYLYQAFSLFCFYGHYGHYASAWYQFYTAQARGYYHWFVSLGDTTSAQWFLNALNQNAQSYYQSLTAMGYR